VKRFFPTPEVCDRLGCQLLGVFRFVSLAASRVAVYRFAIEVQNPACTNLRNLASEVAPLFRKTFDIAEI